MFLLCMCQVCCKEMFILSVSGMLEKKCFFRASGMH